MRPTPKAAVYDSGVLIAADRNERRTWAEYRVRLEADVVPVVPAPVVARASRSPHQAQLRRLLRGCEIVTLDEAQAHAAGALMGKARTKDVVDASVVVLALLRNAEIVTDDAHDILRLLSAARAKLSVVGV
jgi:predicted nucleic acid-binding protein